jgi:trehalose/maltose hydrolase-like predicted phosphorylase
LSGQPDVPENYHTLTYELEKRGSVTHVSLSQDNNATEEEAAHSTGMWAKMLNDLKENVERG